MGIGAIPGVGKSTGNEAIENYKAALGEKNFQEIVKLSQAEGPLSIRKSR